jgi:hypothetical protein
LEKTISYAYEPPAILETFDSLEVLGFAEGFEVYTVGNGSQVSVISLVR